MPRRGGASTRSRFSGGVNPGGAVFPVPDILNRASFELGIFPAYTTPGDSSAGGYGFGDNIYGATPNAGNATRFGRVTDQAHDGAYSIVYGFSPQGPGVERFSNFAWTHPQPLDRFQSAFWCIQLGQTVGVALKFMRWAGPGWANYRGGVYQTAAGLVWDFDAEDGAQQQIVWPSKATQFAGGWHHYEYDYWRNGHPSGYPAVRTYFDGVLQGFASQAPAGGSTAYWDDYWRVAGSRAAGAGNATGLRYCEIMGTTNEQQNTGEIYIDELSFGTLGRIGM